MLLQLGATPWAWDELGGCMWCDAVHRGVGGQQAGGGDSRRSRRAAPCLTQPLGIQPALQHLNFHPASIPNGRPLPSPARCNLLKPGRCPRARHSPGGRSPLHYAASMGHVDCIQALLSHNVQQPTGEALRRPNSSRTK